MAVDSVVEALQDDPEIVADALQDTFVAAWRSVSTHRGDGEVAAWLWGLSGAFGGS